VTPALDGVHVVAAAHSADVAGSLAEYAQRAAPRAVRRLLGGASLAAFAVAVQLSKSQQPALSPDRTGLFTISAWDPSIPYPAFALDESPDLTERLSHFYLNPQNPSDWLRRMPNNPICQVAIATGLRGPNMHYIGTAEALHLIVAVAGQALCDGQADGALVVGYDQPDHRHDVLPDVADCAAAAVLLARRPGLAPVAALLAAAGSAAPETTALEVLTAFVAELPAAAPAAATPGGGGR